LLTSCPNERINTRGQFVAFGCPGYRTQRRSPRRIGERPREDPRSASVIRQSMVKTIDKCRCWIVERPAPARLTMVQHFQTPIPLVDLWQSLRFQWFWNYQQRDTEALQMTNPHSPPSRSWHQR
jgi:hypothetical protein